MLNDLSEIIAIDTTEAPRSAADAPFGAELRRALDWFLNKASSYGLHVGENGGYYGWAEYGAPELPLIGIAAHIDIVPAGSGWDGDPFKMRSDGGRIYGRGVADDKGPLVVMLHLLKELKESGKVLRHRIRLIVGCNEETGSLCLKKYSAEGEIPVVTLVPDSDFPVINSEKGILHTDAVLAPDEVFSANVLSLEGGERANVVPGRASVLLAPNGPFVKAAAEKGGLDFGVFSRPAIARALIEAGARIEDMSIENTDKGVLVSAKGVSGHAMDPDKCDNALWKIFAFLKGALPESRTVAAIYSRICRRDAANEIGVFAEDAESGRLTMNMGAARYSGDKLTLKFDFRLPLCSAPDAVEEKLAAALGGGVLIKRARFADNLYKAEDSRLIRTLLAVYSEVTGEKDPAPIQTGGGTYARELPNAVAFGPTFPGAETNIHNADENIEISHLQRLHDIYLKAIEKLDTLY